MDAAIWSAPGTACGVGRAVMGLERTPHGIVVRDSHGHRSPFDHVVIAAHSGHTAHESVLAPAKTRAYTPDC